MRTGNHELRAGSVPFKIISDFEKQRVGRKKHSVLEKWLLKVWGEPLVLTAFSLITWALLICSVS